MGICGLRQEDIYQSVLDKISTEGLREDKFVKTHFKIFQVLLEKAMHKLDVFESFDAACQKSYGKPVGELLVNNLEDWQVVNAAKAMMACDLEDKPYVSLSNS